MSAPASMSSDERAWSLALDEIEATLREADTLATADLDALPGSRSAGTSGGWEPPADIGPIPAGLMPRATAVFDALAAVTERVAAQHAAIDAELAQLAEASVTPARRASTPVEPPAPRLIDHSA